MTEDDFVPKDHQGETIKVKPTVSVFCIGCGSPLDLDNFGAKDFYYGYCCGWSYVLSRNGHQPKLPKEPEARK